MSRITELQLSLKAPLLYVMMMMLEVFPSLVSGYFALSIWRFDVVHVWSCCFSFLIRLLHSLNTRLKISVLYLLYFWTNSGALVGESFCNDGYLIVTVDEA